MTENLDAFLSDFATSATLPSTAVVRGLFDNAYLDALGIEASGPSFLGKASDLSGLTHGSAVSIGGSSYTVRGIQPDGTGLTRLVLEEA